MTTFWPGKALDRSSSRFISPSFLFITKGSDREQSISRLQSSGTPFLLPPFQQPTIFLLLQSESTSWILFDSSPTRLTLYSISFDYRVYSFHCKKVDSWICFKHEVTEHWKWRARERKFLIQLIRVIAFKPDNEYRRWPTVSQPKKIIGSNPNSSLVLVLIRWRYPSSDLLRLPVILCHPKCEGHGNQCAHQCSKRYRVRSMPLPVHSYTKCHK